MLTFPRIGLPGKSSQVPLIMDEISLLLTLVAQPKHQSWAGPSERRTWAHVLTTAFPVKGTLVTWKFGRRGKQRFRERGSHTKPGRVCFHPYIPDLWSEPYGAICNPRAFLSQLCESYCCGCHQACWAECVAPTAECVLKSLRLGILRTAEWAKWSLGRCRAVEGVALTKWMVVQDSRHGDTTMTCRVGGGVGTRLLWRRGKLHFTEKFYKGPWNQEKPGLSLPYVVRTDYTKDILSYEC